jgi:chorismate synthase
MRKRKEKSRFISGVRHGRSIGSPIAIYIPNGERERWAKIMSPHREDEEAGTEGEITRPRPGHADLAGAMKYGTRDIRNILERASARETAARVAVGACAKALLGNLDIRVGSHVVSIGPIKASGWHEGVGQDILSGERSLEEADTDPMRCLDREVSDDMMAQIDAAQSDGDTLGGVFEVVALGVPIGLGSHVQWDRRLDSRLASALMSIPGIKGVEIGPAFENANLRGSSVHDPIRFGLRNRNRGAGFYRETNRAGGIEGGISNGEEIVARAAMKPIPTLKNPLESVDLTTLEPDLASVERGDVCAVPAAGIVGEAVVAMVLAELLLEKTGGDTLREIRKNLAAYLKDIEDSFHRPQDGSG